MLLPTRIEPINRLRILFSTIRFNFILIISFLQNTFSVKTKNIIILGSKGAGKTTLWSQLQNKILDLSPAPTDMKRVESFKIMGIE